MAVAQLLPNDRYALLGKTGSGKTALGMVLAGTFARALPWPWEVWWVDTKNDPKDLAALRKWGFRNAASEQDRGTYGAQPNALYFRIASTDGHGKDLSTVDQAQTLFAEAYKRRKVLVVVDEYTQVVPSSRSAGKPLLDIFTRGRGVDVGLIGHTQEPVYVPRQLISQASHQIFLTLTHAYDVKYVKGLEPVYEPPARLGDKYGFFWKHVDGTGEVTYYPNQRVWYDNLQVRLPTPPDQDPTLQVA